MRKAMIDALFPKTRQLILSACLLQPEKWWYLSDLANHLNVSPSSLQRELASLTDAGILDSKRDSGRAYYKANIDSPGISELQSLLIKTTGVVDQIKSALKPHLTGIAIAFVYGSLARSEEISSSDVDVMVIGNLKLTQISTAIKKLQTRLDREVNITFYTQQDFVRRLREKNDFLLNVLKNKKIFIKGSDDELKDLA